MKLNVFERMLKGRKDTGKLYAILVSVKEIAIPFCCLAKQNNFPLDGVVVVNQPQILPQDYSGVPVVDPRNVPFNPRLCFMMIGVPGYPLQSIWQPFTQMGFQTGFALLDSDIKEIFETLQRNNLIADKIREELSREPSERILIFDSTPKTQTIKNVLAIAGVPIDGTIKSIEDVSSNALVIVPVENIQHQALVQAMEQKGSGRIVPLYAGDLLAAEYYSNATQMFRGYFDCDNAPDFVIKHETTLKHIVNSYDGVNISALSVENDAQVMMACALASSSADKRILQVALPINAQGNLVNYEAGANNFLLKQFPARLRLITFESREFWRYFIKRLPNFVTYSLDVRSFFAARYRNEPLKVEPLARGASTEDYILFSLDGKSDWYEDVRAELQARGHRVERLDKPRCSAEGVELMSKAKLIVSDSMTDRWAAMLCGAPIVLINMTSYTLDYDLTVCSDATPILILPKDFSREPGHRVPMLRDLLNFEVQITDPNVRMQVYAQNGISFVDNTSNEIVAAVEEMLSRLAGTFEYRGEEAYMEKTVQRLIGNSKAGVSRGVPDSHISIDFLRDNKVILGAVYSQRDKFMPENFLPREKLQALKTRSNTKIKVRICHFSYWNALRTICEACRRDNEIDLLLISDGDKEKDFLQNEGYKCLTKVEYDLKTDQPDVLVLNRFHEEVHRQIGDIRRYSRLIVVPTFSVTTGDSLAPLIQVIQEYWAPYDPDYYLFDSYIYNRIKSLDYFKDKNIVEMGNAKYDGIYIACHNKIPIDDWEKLNGKKIILWATGHGLYDGTEMIKSLSFDLYAKYIFQYMAEHQNFGLIFRPHPMFINELTNRNAFWSEEDMYNFREYCSESSNIVFDETDSYDNAFSMADIIITDSHCGITMSSLPMKKPICVTYKSRNALDTNVDALKHCYKVYSPEELFDFLDMIERGDDPMYQVREKAAREYVKHFDGKNGWRIKEFIKQAFKDKCN